MSRSARPIIGISNENKVRLKVEFFQPEIPRTNRDWLVGREQGEGWQV